MKIRRAWGPDLPAVLECLKELSDSPPTPREAITKAFNEILDRKGRVYVVENEDAKVVGTATLIMRRMLLHSGGMEGRIEEVAVKKDYQGKGYGKALINHLCQDAQSFGCYKVTLTCTPELASFYERCGLKVVGLTMRIDV